MSDFRRSDDLAADEVDRRLIAAVRDAYLEPGLPPVGPELTEVFARGLTGREAVLPAAPTWAPGATAGPARGRRRGLAWGLRSRAAFLALGAAAVSVNLVGVGAAGLLPGPLQSGFERVTESVGIEVPGSSSRAGGGGRADRLRPPASTSRRGGPGAEPGRTGGAATPGATDREADLPGTGGRSDPAQPGGGPSSRPADAPPTATTSTSTSVPGGRRDPTPGADTNKPPSPSTTMPCPPVSAPPLSALPPVTAPGGGPVPPGVGQVTPPGASACTTTTTRAGREPAQPPGRGARP